MIATAPTSNYSSKGPKLNDMRAGLPNICGQEETITEVANTREPVFLSHTNLDISKITSGFACALHMHQPTIPAGAGGEPISNLQHMFENQGDGDNHNASVFAWCYKRMGEWIPELVAKGDNPRIMLDYSGNLFWAFRQMGREDIINDLKRLCEPQYQPYVEWMGTMWSHAVVPSTPIPDIKLHIQAWQHHFAAMFGYEALARVKGFSPPEMHLPNHPDTLFEYIKALKDCGYQWLLVQEDSVEQLNGDRIHHDNKYIPNRLVARNSRGFNGFCCGTLWGHPLPNFVLTHRLTHRVVFWINPSSLDHFNILSAIQSNGTISATANLINTTQKRNKVAALLVHHHTA
ncbi:MAG: hypothetical protein AAF050_23250, partial [Cyanobacteria bacterium J06649_5]